MRNTFRSDPPAGREGIAGVSEDEPNLVTSHLSRPVTWNGHRLQLEIYRLERDPTWTLEVVNEEGTSTVWDEQFASDREAEAMFRETLKVEGLAAFRDTNVIPFPRGRE